MRWTDDYAMTVQLKRFVPSPVCFVLSPIFKGNPWAARITRQWGDA